MNASEAPPPSKGGYLWVVLLTIALAIALVETAITVDMEDTTLPATIGIICAAAGFVLVSLSLCLRWCKLRDKEGKRGGRRFGWGDPKIMLCLALWIAGALLAFEGWFHLARGGSEAAGVQNGGEYTDVLTVLSLLAAGSIAGWCAVEYGKFEADEAWLLNIISWLFMATCYTLFTAICYCVGDSETKHVWWVIPVAMVLVVAMCALIDMADYRMPGCCKSEEGSQGKS